MGMVILVNSQQVEPVSHLGFRPKPLDFMIPEGTEHALISNIAQPKQGKLCKTLL
jgi:hypothetical protein